MATPAQEILRELYQTAKENDFKFLPELHKSDLAVIAIETATDILGDIEIGTGNTNDRHVIEIHSRQIVAHENGNRQIKIEVNMFEDTTVSELNKERDLTKLTEQHFFNIRMSFEVWS